MKVISTARRSGAVLALAGTLLASAASLTPASAVTPSVDQGAAATYLVDGLTGGTHFEGSYPDGMGGTITYIDYGLTVDGILAFAASGLDSATVPNLANYIGNEQGNYIDPSGTAYGPYPGAAGKTAVMAEVLGYDPRAFYGVDLIGFLDSHVCDHVDASAYDPCQAVGSYSNIFSITGQAFGVLAQLRAGDTAGVAAPEQYLLSTQDAQGWWPSTVPTTGKSSDVDSTAMAAMALAADPSAAAQAAVTKALTWIASVQAVDGSFPGTAGESTNSTGLAVQALTLKASSYAAAIASGKAFLGTTQNGDGGLRISDVAGTSDLRATAQALSGAAGTPLTTLTDSISGLTPSSTGLATSATSVTAGTPVTLAATISPPTAKGTVVFTADGGPDGNLGTANVTSGTASLSYTWSAAGSHSITARFVPTAASAIGSTSAAKTVTVTTPVTPPTAKAPAVVTAPSLAGSGKVGTNETVVTGAWTGTPSPTFTFQWLLDNEPIDGAVAPSYPLTGHELGHTLSVRVTAANSAGSAQAITTTITVARGAKLKVLAAPSIKGAPGGHATAGKKLTAGAGRWDGPSIHFAYRWRLNGKPIAGATKSSFTPNATQHGTITLAVTATSTGRTATTVVSKGVRLP